MNLIQLYEDRTEYILNSEWSVGANDRGMGRACHAVILKQDLFSWEGSPSHHSQWTIKCDSVEVAVHLAALHNESLSPKNKKIADKISTRDGTIVWLKLDCMYEEDGDILPLASPAFSSIFSVPTSEIDFDFETDKARREELRHHPNVPEGIVKDYDGPVEVVKL